MKHKKQQGFTIVEVLIVLAIAGLILMIVFLAVPSLQRNSRNNRRRADVSNYLSAVNEYVNNNNGALPSTAANLTTVNNLVKLGFLTAPASVQTGARNSAVSVDSIELVTVAKCDTANIGNTIAGSQRQFAVRYSVEDSSGNPVPQCVDS